MISDDTSSIVNDMPTDSPVFDSNADRDDIGRTYCVGHGVEIGAGVRPTQVHPDAKLRFADKRSDEELKAYFLADDVVRVESLDSLLGQKFDFLIAHHVLEHCSNVIETLIEWISLVRDDGILYLSLPNRDTTPDFLRLQTPPAHFLLDYLNRSSEDDYESRGHIAEFLWSWYDVGGLEGKDKHEAAMLVHQALHAERNDLHWHTFTLQTVKFVVAAAAELSGREARLLFSQDGHKRREEHRAVFRIIARAGAETTLVSQLQTLRASLRESIDRYVLHALNGVVVRSLSSAGRQAPMLVECGSLRPIGDHEILDGLDVAGQEPLYVEIGAHGFDNLPEAANQQVPLLTPTFARRLHRFVGRWGARFSIREAVGAAPVLRVEIFRDPFSPCVDEAEIALPVVSGDADVFEWMSAELGKGAFYYVVLDDILGALPDFVRTLSIASASLQTGGKLLIGIKDRRRSCGQKRRDSDIGDVLAASEANLLQPSRAMRFMHDSSIILDNSAATPVPRAEINGPSIDASRMPIESGAAGRIECFVFSMLSMSRLLDLLSRVRLRSIGHFVILEDNSEVIDFIVDINVVSPSP